MSQISLRNLPPALERELRIRARRNKQSLNRTITELLARSLGLSSLGSRGAKKRDLSGLKGTWTAAEAAEFDRATAIFEAIDPELWP